MPSKSKAQRNLMAAAAHNPAFAKKVGVPVSVAKEFNQADKGKKFGKGGETMKHSDVGMDKKVVKKAVKMHDAQLHGGKKTDLKGLKKGGMCKGYKEGGVAKTVTKEMEYDYKTGKKSFAGSTAKKDAHAEKEGKRVAKDLAYDKAKKFAEGGSVEEREKQKKMYDAAEKMDKEPYSPMDAMKRLLTPKKETAKPAPKKYCRGGGIEVRGKTKGRMV